MPRRKRIEVKPLVLVPIDSMTPAEMKRLLPALRDDELPKIRRRMRHRTDGLSWRDDSAIGLRLTFAWENGLPIDEAVLAALMRRLQWPKTWPCSHLNEPPVRADGYTYVIVDPPGCRIYFASQEELAKEVRCSTSKLKAQIRLMWELEIILASGHGWIEFDAQLAWKGELLLREAYIDFQQQHLIKKLEFV
jgi:hypothetical protein